MPLVIGTRLGPYEVLAAIGAGGMGEVYRARDTKLNRHVALKVLPDVFTADPERVVRFQREAQLLASLSHPNIAAIYGLEESNGVRALVLELVDGPTLADRIAQGPIPLDEALPIARQIAEALEAAHEKGVIHRDLKPANVKVTADGTVKVLDFGLAKLLDAEASRAGEAGGTGGLTNSPTMTTPVIRPGYGEAGTMAGAILGTAAYMSPEQAKGRPADKRSDIWAFGCVLYEMLTGKQAFAGEEVSDILAAVLRAEPNWNALPAEMPPIVRTAVLRCLEKDAKRRVRDIGDVQLLLSGVFESPRPLEERTSGFARLIPGFPNLYVAVAVVASTALLTAIATREVTRSTIVSPRPVRFQMSLPTAQSVAVGTFERGLALSPDGTRLAYIDTNGNLVVRPMDRLDAEPLRLVSNARGPFWSPDGQWIGFFASDGTELRKVFVNGGAAITVCRTVGQARGASWGPDGTILFATNSASAGLMSVRADGGEPKVLTNPDGARGERGHVFPSIVPGGRAAVFTIGGVSSDDAQVGVLDLSTGMKKTLVKGTNPEILETGHLLYGAAGTLRAVRFDARRLEVVGDSVPIVEQVAVNGGAYQFSVARNGTLVYVVGAGMSTSVRRSLVWVDRSGRETSTKAPARAYTTLRLSPDGARLAVAIASLEEGGIWVWDFARETFNRLSFGRTVDQTPSWTPDGRRIVFSSRRGGVSNLFWQAADGTGTAERLTSSPNPEFSSSMLPDGRSLVVLEQREKTGNDLVLFRLDGNPQSEPLLATESSETNPELSPDGRWLAYTSDDSGRNEVYVRPFPNVQAGRWQVSLAGGARPVWTRGGKELVYGALDGAIMALRVETDTSFAHSTPTRLFDWPTLGVPAVGRTYDVAPDGQRLLMIKEPGAGDSASPVAPGFVVVLNWTEELKRLVPPK